MYDVMLQRNYRRRAASTAEVLIAIALLVVATSLVGGFVSQVSDGLRDRETSSRLEWELLNAREVIGSWSADEITAERIAELPISAALADRVKNAKLRAIVAQIDKPARAMQVTLGIRCEWQDQLIEPSTLTFWVPLEQSEQP